MGISIYDCGTTITYFCSSWIHGLEPLIERIAGIRYQQNWHQIAISTFICKFFYTFGGLYNNSDTTFSHIFLFPTHSTVYLKSLSSLSHVVLLG